MANFHIEYFSAGPIAHAQPSHAHDVAAQTLDAARRDAFAWVDHEEVGEEPREELDAALRITNLGDGSAEVWERDDHGWKQVTQN